MTALQRFGLALEWLTKPALNGTVWRNASASEPGRGCKLELGFWESCGSSSGWWEQSLLVRGFLEDASRFYLPVAVLMLQKLPCLSCVLCHISFPRRTWYWVCFWYGVFQILIVILKKIDLLLKVRAVEGETFPAFSACLDLPEHVFRRPSI